MSTSLIIIFFFVCGLAAGHWHLVDLSNIPLSMIVLALLMFTVGITIGRQPDKMRGMLRKNYRFFMLPFFTIAGTFVGAMVCRLIIGRWPLGDFMSVGAGLGYYSLSSVIISEVRGVELGTIALLSNVFREIIALLGAPIFFRLFGPLAPIACGGATTADTTLPIVMRTCGTDYTAISIFHGMVCDFSVPFLVTLTLLF